MFNDLHQYIPSCSCTCIRICRPLNGYTCFIHIHYILWFKDIIACMRGVLWRTAEFAMYLYNCKTRSGHYSPFRKKNFRCAFSYNIFCKVPKSMQYWRLSISCNRLVQALSKKLWFARFFISVCYVIIFNCSLWI